jgi:hypothetical protein
MGLFNRDQSVKPTTKLPGGEDVIRAGLKVRVTKRENLINLSRSLEVPQDALLDFVSGQSNMNAEALSVIAAFLWPNARYDEASDKLVGGSKEPTPMAAAGYPPMTRSPYPPPIQPRTEFAPPPQPGFVGGAGLSKPYRKADGWA